MDKNTIKEVSIEDLLSALDNKQEDSTDIIVDDVVFLFIQAFNIKAGKNKVSSKLLYDLFKLWNTSETLTPVKFSMQLSKYFEKPDENSKFYLLNKEIADIVKTIHQYNVGTSTAPKADLGIKSKNVHRHFNKFIDKYGIQPGKLYVECDILYHLYDTWCYNKKIKTLSYTRFKELCMMFFDSKKLSQGNVNWIGVDPSIKQHIDTTTVSNWREGRKRRGKEKEEEYKIRKRNKKEILYPETQTQNKTPDGEVCGSESGTES
jgi:hypothetical protein